MYQQKLSMPSYEDTKILSQEVDTCFNIAFDSLERSRHSEGGWRIAALVNLNFVEPFAEIEVDNKISPLICACYLGRMEIVKLLLMNESIDVDLASEDSGQTPLTISAITGNYEIMKLLLDGDAEVNKPNAFNQTPIICCFARLEEDKNVFENRKICMKMAELLLHYGADVNWIVDKNHGYTLLMQLCSVKMELSQKEKEINQSTIKFLLENGANKNLKSGKGKTIFQLAEKHKNKEKLIELLQTTQQVYFYNNRPVIQRQIYAPKNLYFDEKRNKKWVEYLAFCNK